MGDLRTAFDETVTANAEVVAGIDAAVIASGRAVADQIDYAIDNLSGEAGSDDPSTSAAPRPAVALALSRHSQKDLQDHVVQYRIR